METKTAISANELMLGNWVRIKEHFYTGRITVIDIENDMVKTDVEEFFEPLTFEDLEPIPLSVELLEKCGFVKHLDGMMYKWESKDFKEHAENGEAYPHLTMYLRRHLIPDNSYCFAYNNYRSYPFQYLHQLQNLALLVTGQPLTIEL